MRHRLAFVSAPALALLCLGFAAHAQPAAAYIPMQVKTVTDGGL